MENFFLDYFQDLKNALDKIDLNTFKKINKLLLNALENGNQIFTLK